nr:D-alanyl-D-alanine carboxypeptidase family protein [Specibacter cremeus]
MDIGNPNGECSLLACFASTPAGRYATDNVWRYGFIIRYPDGYTSITGYAYEPWHLRYVGVRVATDMRDRGYRTLEQYLGLPAAPSY